MKQVILFAALLCTPISTAYADDYRAFAAGLKASDAAVNRMKFDGVMYALNEATAKEYFEQYFKQNRMTYALSVNLGYPLECWGKNHVNLEKGISPVLLGIVSGFLSQYNSLLEMSKVMSHDPALHDHVFFGLYHLVRIARADKLSQADMQSLARKVFSIITASHLCSSRNKEIDPKQYPYVNAIKTQLLLTAFSFAHRGGIISEFAEAAGVTGPRAQRLSSFEVFTADNNWFDTKQLRGIRNFVEKMPAHLRFPVTITCFDHTVSKENKLINVHSLNATRKFNIFGTRVGKVASKPFPGNYDRTVETDGFMIVLAHEYAHNVESKFLGAVESLRTFRDRLIEMAGNQQENYLRSMFDDGFFIKHKNEFIASLANQYFGSTKDMFRLALQKAEEGNYNQINQFVLMASIFSQDDKSLFYQIEPRGTIRRTPHNIVKKDDLVTHLRLGKKTYQFVYTDGVITGIR